MTVSALYSETVLEHNRAPRNFGPLRSATHRGESHNASCGDHVAIQAELSAAGHVLACHFEGESCAICKASSSMMTTNVKGKSVEEAEQMIQEFRDMATGKLDTGSQPNHLGRLSVFAGVRDLPSRVKCAILPWHTLHAALNSEASISTEGDRDPVATER